MPTAAFDPPFIVSTDWLARRLGDSRLVVLDATVHLLPRPVDPVPDVPYDVVTGQADFEKGHIPGARFADIENHLSDPDAATHFMLPSPARFADGMARLGVGDDTLVVCYATAFHWWATRLWWMLRVFGHERVVVLDGGFQKWKAEGRPVDTGPAAGCERRVFTARYRPEMVATRADVEAAIGATDTCTVNALRPEQHAGGGTTNYGRPGHISGSTNAAAALVVGPDNAFRPLPALLEMLAEPLSRPKVITYCGGGIAASSITLLLTLFGHPDVRLYDASLSEWARDPRLPMSVTA
ncbi:MAG: sulfurtransferase [Burkholderiales bacterium]